MIKTFEIELQPGICSFAKVSEWKLWIDVWTEEDLLDGLYNFKVPSEKQLYGLTADQCVAALARLVNKESVASIRCNSDSLAMLVDEFASLGVIKRFT